MNLIVLFTLIFLGGALVGALVTLLIVAAMAHHKTRRR